MTPLKKEQVGLRLDIPAYTIGEFGFLLFMAREEYLHIERQHQLLT